MEIEVGKFVSFKRELTYGGKTKGEKFIVHLEDFVEVAGDTRGNFCFVGDGILRYFMKRDVKECISVEEKREKDKSKRAEAIEFSGFMNNLAENQVDKKVEEGRKQRGSHYHEGGIDVFAFIEANLSKEEARGFYRGNAIKYLVRYGKKDGRNEKDLLKANDYINQLIDLDKEE